MTTLAPSRSNSSATSLSEEDAIPLFIYTLEMFLLWFSVLLSACILTFLMRLKKFPMLFRVIYCVWNLRNLAVAVARTSSLVLVIFKEQGATSDYILAQAHEAIEYISAFAIAALAVERLIANRSGAYRDRVCGLSWLEREPISFLNIGQFVNDARSEKGNVQYIDVDIFDWPIALLRWLPYTTYRPRDVIAGVHDGIPLRIVALVTTRDIREGEELCFDYLSC